MRAGVDTGSTTGVATAVLALLSAGMLAAFGVVTAGELRDLGPAPQRSQAGVFDPPDITFSPAPTAHSML